MEPTYFINAEGRDALLSQQINRALLNIDERLRDLEFEKAKKDKKPALDRAQKMVLLKELGVLDYLSTLDISQKNLSKVLALVLEIDQSNAEKDLSSRNDPKSHLLIEKNYAVAVSTFRELNLKVYELKAQEHLDKISKNKF